MNTQLNELEVKLQKLYDEKDFNNMRAIFDIGVQFGALLQRQNIQDYEYVFWKKLDETEEKEQLIREAVKSIEKFLLGLVQNSIKDYISRNGSWSVAKENWSSEYDEFDAGTRRKYCVQITGVAISKLSGSFLCNFKVVGRLAKLFKRQNIDTQFDVHVYNTSGKRKTNIRRIKSVSSTVSRLDCFVRNSNNWEPEHYRDFLYIISKEFLFDLIKEA